MSNLSIYAGHLARRHGPPRPAPAAAPLPVAPPPPPRPQLPEAELAAILDSPPAGSETIDAAFKRKERELLAVFAALPLDAARALHARLTAPDADDVLAARFARLAQPRRERLLAFLADARRRAAVSAR